MSDDKNSPSCGRIRCLAPGHGTFLRSLLVVYFNKAGTQREKDVHSVASFNSKGSAKGEECPNTIEPNRSRWCRTTSSSATWSESKSMTSQRFRPCLTRFAGKPFKRSRDRSGWGNLFARRLRLLQRQTIATRRSSGSSPRSRSFARSEPAKFSLRPKKSIEAVVSRSVERESSTRRKICSQS